MRNFICQHFTDEHKNCYCGKETIGITLDGFKPIHTGKNGELIICEPQFKIGEYVRLKKGGGYGVCRTDDVVQVYHSEGLDSYHVLKGGNAWSGFCAADFEKIHVPEFYMHRHKLILGCVFEKDNKKYVVEEAGSGWDASGARMGFEHEDGEATWEIIAKELGSNDEYIADNPTIEFAQYGEIEVLNMMKRQVNFA